MQTIINAPRTLATVVAFATVLTVGLRLVQANPHAKISSNQANAIVLKRFPGKITEKTTLENEEGKWQYGVMVQSGKTLREVMVDANSGKIASVEVTSAAKERDEKKQDAAAAHSQKSSANEKKDDDKESDEKGEHGEEKD